MKKYFLILLAVLFGVALVYGFWVYGEMLKQTRRGTPITYKTLLQHDLSTKQKALFEWWNNVK